MMSRLSFLLMILAFLAVLRSAQGFPPLECPTGAPTCTAPQIINPLSPCQCITLPFDCTELPECAAGQIVNPLDLCSCLDLPALCLNTGLPTCDLTAGEVIDPFNPCECTQLPGACLADGLPTCPSGQIMDPFDICNCIDFPVACLSLEDITGCEIGQVFNPIGEDCGCVDLPGQCLITGLPTCDLTQGEIINPLNICECTTITPICPDDIPTCGADEVINPADPCSCIPVTTLTCADGIPTCGADEIVDPSDPCSCIPSTTPPTSGGSNVSSRTQSVRLKKIKASSDIIISIGEL